MTSTARDIAEVDVDQRSPRHVSGWHDAVAALVGRLVSLAAIWSLISIPLRRFAWPDWVDSAFGVLNLPAEPSIFVVVLMFIVGSALRRRLRAAMIAVLVFETLSVVLQTLLLVAVDQRGGSLALRGGLGIGRGQTVLLVSSTIVGAVVAIVLWLSRRAFPARLAAGSRLRSVGVLVTGLAVSALVTVLLTEAFPRTLHGTERTRWALRATFGAAYRSNAVGLHGHSGYHWITSLAGVMSALALLGALAVFLRSARARQFLSARDELALRKLILEAGERDSLAYFATRRDKAVLFSPDGRAAVTYRVLASVSLASGDPVGHQASWPGAITAWLDDARSHGWFPAVLSASEDGATAYVNAGLKARAIGDEAIVKVNGFSLEGRTMRPVRQAVGRVLRAGYTIQVRRHGDIGDREFAELQQHAHDWRGDAAERGFSMALERLSDPSDARCLMVTAHDRAGVVRGLLSFVPWGAGGLSLDLMRRDRAAENGLTEFMVNGLLEASRELGVRRISLNFAVFRSVFSSAERVGAGPITRFTDAGLSVASRFWQLESLYRSNAKYLPSWVPRFLCYDSSLTLSRAAIAAGMAEGFLPAPHPPPPRTLHETVSLDSGVTVEFSEAVRLQEEQWRSSSHWSGELTQQQRARRQKIDRLARVGCEAYPVSVPRDRHISEARAEIGRRPVTPDQRVSVTGRVRALRDLGGVSFAVLCEQEASLQAMLTADTTPASRRRLWKQTVDLGDLVSVTGTLVRSRSGEPSVLVEDWTMAAKCLRPLPGVLRGVTNPETRVRQRYLDIMVNPDSMRLLQSRSTVVRTLRDSLWARGFTEVETPMLQAVHGGAAARPFRTHINAYDTDLYLRIAPELYLKQLCVGGMDKIFELNRNFRNEGADATHNPEFTSVEAYQAYADYDTMRELTRELIIKAAQAVHGDPVAVRRNEHGEQQRVDLGGEWPVISVYDAVTKAAGTTVCATTTSKELREICRERKIRPPARATPGDLVLELYSELVEKVTSYPTFYVDFPLETSPLTRVHRHDPALSERWDLVAFGTEIGTAYSELTDPLDQRRRLIDQSTQAAAGNPEAMHIDEAFLTALEYAMPPTGGLGLGVDRLVMMLTGANIRATMAFPFVRPGKYS